MPLLALKHRCLAFIKDNAPLIECFEQASFKAALNHEHVNEYLNLPYPEKISSLLPFLGQDELALTLSALRHYALPLVIKLEIFSMLAQERLQILKAACAQSRGKEQLYASTAYESLLCFCEYIFSHANSQEIGMFFDDYRSCAQYFKDDSRINLPPFYELFNWSEDDQKRAKTQAKRAFSSLLRSRNRRAKYLAQMNSKNEFASIKEFFTQQDAVLKDILAAEDS